jgi:hypothetical protein
MFGEARMDQSDEERLVREALKQQLAKAESQAERLPILEAKARQLGEELDAKARREQQRRAEEADFQKALDG